MNKYYVDDNGAQRGTAPKTLAQQKESLALDFHELLKHEFGDKYERYAIIVSLQSPTAPLRKDLHLLANRSDREQTAVMLLSMLDTLALDLAVAASESRN